MPELKSGSYARGAFGPGNPVKPRGARQKATPSAALLSGAAMALARKPVELAQAGDSAALRLCLERIAPE